MYVGGVVDAAVICFVLNIEKPIGAYCVLFRTYSHVVRYKYANTKLQLNVYEWLPLMAPSHLVEFPVGRIAKTTQDMVQWSYWHACWYLSRYNEPFQNSSKQIIIAVYIALNA